MITVILSAGKSTRFKHEGYVNQKSMVPMPDGRTLLQWQVERLAPERLIYITRAEYRKSEEPMLKTLRFRDFRHKEMKVLFIEKKTAGPLDGLWAVRKHLRTKEELVIAYNDELIEHDVLKRFVSQARINARSAGVVCFSTDDKRFTRIPKMDFACGCTYYFRSGLEFVKLMAKNDRGPTNGCPDIVYASKTWFPFFLDEDEYIELGTANEYKNWMSQQGFPVQSW